MPINKITHVCLTHDKVRAQNLRSFRKNTASVERSFIGFFMHTERMADKSTAKTVSRLARKETPRWSGNTKTAFLSKSLRKNTGSKREAYIAP